MAALAAEPHGLVLAPLRLGPRILVATDQEVRRRALSPQQRRQPLRARDADRNARHRPCRSQGARRRYVAVCLGDTDLPRLLAYRHGSLLQALVNDNAAGLARTASRAGPIRAWRVVD